MLGSKRALRKALNPKGLGVFSIPPGPGLDPA
jgi:hypothetical protein